MTSLPVPLSAGDEDGDVAGRDAVDFADDVPHGGALEDGEGVPLMVSRARRRVLASSFWRRYSTAFCTSASSFSPSNWTFLRRKLKAPRLMASTAQETASLSLGAPVRTMTWVSGQRFLTWGSRARPSASGSLTSSKHDVGLFQGKGPLERGAAVGGGDLVVLFQERRQHGALALVIVNYQDFTLHRNSSWLRTQAASKGAEQGADARRSAGANRSG